MTDTKSKALALELLNTVRDSRGLPTATMEDAHGFAWFDALCRAIEREAATEARHAAELRELKERFDAFRREVSDELAKFGCWPDTVNLQRFILPAPDPLVEAMVRAWPQYADRMEACNNDAKALCAAIEARGGKIVWEAGELVRHQPKEPT